MPSGLAIAAAAVAGAAASVSTTSATSRNPSTTGEKVHIECPDGFELAAMYHPADEAAATDGEAQPGVLLLHQCDRDGPETGYEPLVPLLAARGLHVLVLDYRGYGESRDAQFTGENWRDARPYFESDGEAALAYLVGRDGVDAGRIGLVGASCGGSLALHLANGHDGVRALAFLSCGLGRDVPAAMGLAAERPMLCIAAEDDPHGNAAPSMRRAFEASAHPASRLVIYKGQRHGTPLFEQDEHLPALIADWLVAQLNAP